MVPLITSTQICVKNTANMNWTSWAFKSRFAILSVHEMLLLAAEMAGKWALGLPMSMKNGGGVREEAQAEPVKGR